MPFLPASLSWAPIITMGSRPGGPSTDLPTVTRPLQPAPGAVMAAPQAMLGLVMPGVRPGASPILARSQLNRTSTSDA